MNGINRADKDYTINKAFRTLNESFTGELPCVFISYQRNDEDFASEIAEYLQSREIDVYVDLDDKDLKLARQLNNPSRVTSSIRNGLNESNYMLVIVSPTTYKSLWVPFEIGYAYEAMGRNMKILRHKGIDRATLPHYLQVKEILNGRLELARFVGSIRTSYGIYESISKASKVKTYSSYSHERLNEYLDLV